MPKLVGFSRFAALLEEQISDKINRRVLPGDQGMIVWWSIGAGVHVEPHSHANECYCLDDSTGAGRQHPT